MLYSPGIAGFDGARPGIMPLSTGTPDLNVQNSPFYVIAIRFKISSCLETNTKVPVD
jgi:hypothetical protein